MAGVSSALAGKVALVTGGAGFIGSHLVEELMKQGCMVKVFDNFSSGKQENIRFMKDGKNSINLINIITGSITDLKALEKAMKDIDIVFHEAAQTSVQRSIDDPMATNQINVIGTLHMLMAARKNDVKRIILASSASIYGDVGRQQCKEDMKPSPLSPYAASKASAEIYCSQYYHLYGMSTIMLRYFNVYGPRQDPNSAYASVIPRFLDCFAENKQPTIFGDGEQSRDFVHVKDVVQANMLAAQVKVSGECINIGSGKEITINSLLKLFEEITDKKKGAKREPARKGDIQYSIASIEKAKKILGFSPAVSLKEGLGSCLKNN